MMNCINLLVVTLLCAGLQLGSSKTMHAMFNVLATIFSFYSND